MTQASQTTPRILVLGASGQVGSAFVRALGKAAIPAGRGAASPNGDPTWLQLDLQSIASDPSLIDGLVEKHEFTAIVCAAGATDVERCETDLAWAETTNHTGPAILAREAKNIPFVFFSTDYVFDGLHGPYEEPDEPNPLSVYGSTKLAGEREVLQAHPGALIVRTTGVYGPDRQGKNFLYTLRKLLNSGKSMSVPVDQLATPTHNDDIARAVLAMMRMNAAGILNVAGPEFLSRYDFALQACGLLGLDAHLVRPVETSALNQKAARPLRAGLSTGTLQAFLGSEVMRVPAQGIQSWLATEASHRAS